MFGFMIGIPLFLVFIGALFVRNNIGKILITLGTVGIIGDAVLFALVFISFFTSIETFYSIIIIIVAITVIVAVACALWKVLKKKAVYIPICAVLGLCALTTLGFWGYHCYIDNIPTIGEGADVVRTYAPYAPDTKVVDLDEESTLKLTENIPVMDGATALYPIYSAFAKAVIDNIQDYNMNYYLRCSRTSYAYKRITEKEVDIIFAAAPSEEQAAYAEENGVELIYTPIGKEAFVFFVNSKNPIDNITTEQIQQIYSGEITDWSELGIKGMGEIKAFQRNEGSGSQSALIRLMGDKELMSAPITEDIIGDMGTIIHKTADYKNFKNAIGYSFRFYSTEMAANDQIKLLSIDGVYPSIENIENGTYPHASEFYAVTRSDASENTKRLVEWIQGAQGQKLIEKTGYTPISRK